MHFFILRTIPITTDIAPIEAMAERFYEILYTLIISYKQILKVWVTNQLQVLDYIFLNSSHKLNFDFMKLRSNAK